MLSQSSENVHYSITKHCLTISSLDYFKNYIESILQELGVIVHSILQDCGKKIAFEKSYLAMIIYMTKYNPNTTLLCFVFSGCINKKLRGLWYFWIKPGVRCTAIFFVYSHNLFIWLLISRKHQHWNLILCSNKSLYLQKQHVSLNDSNNVSTVKKATEYLIEIMLFWRVLFSTFDSLLCLSKEAYIHMVSYVMTNFWTKTLY